MPTRHLQHRAGVEAAFLTFTLFFQDGKITHPFIQMLKPSGLVLPRDYGLHDLSQLRFKVQSRLTARREHLCPRR